MYRFLFVFMLLSAVMPSLSAQEDIPFKRYNVDIDKYQFAKSFIISLSYYSRVAERLALEDPEVVRAKSDQKAIGDFIKHRTLDNTELRIAKNYLTKYAESMNGLIRKVSVDTVEVYERLLELSVRERELWQDFGRFHMTGEPQDFDEQGFAQRQLDLAREKKEVAKELLRQAVFMRSVLLSADRCESEDCFDLVLTDDERYRLSKKLDGFAKGHMEWGMQDGQTTVDACVAAVREVLEDPMYVSRP